MQVIGWAGSDIMAFTETWRREGIPPPEIEGFSGYNFARPRRLQRSPEGPPRGGIIIYIKNNIDCHVTEGVPELETDPTNSLAVVRINKAAGFETDLYLIVTYIVPSAPQSVWSLLEDWVRILLTKGQVLVVGDQNARTREEADFPGADLTDANTELTSGPTCSARRNKDPMLNISGRRMLTMCKRTGLRIANGRVSGNMDGNFTFHSAPNPRTPDGGRSAIDNVLACPSAFSLITRMTVEPAAFSDHSAVIVQLTLNQNTSSQICPIQTQCINTKRMVGAAHIQKWVDEVLPGIADKFDRIKQAAPGSAELGAQSLHSLCQEFDDICAASFPQQDQTINGSKREPRWFDAELAHGRRVAQRAMRRNPESAIARQLQRECRRILKSERIVFLRSKECVFASLEKESDAKILWQKYKTT